MALATSKHVHHKIDIHANQYIVLCIDVCHRDWEVSLEGCACELKAGSDRAMRRISRAANSALLSGSVIEVHAMQLNALLRDSHPPVLLYIWAPWCPPCRTMGPEIEQAADALKGLVVVARLNAAADSQVLTAWHIASVPTLLLYASDGMERARFLGALTANRIVDWALEQL